MNGGLGLEKSDRDYWIKGGVHDLQGNEVTIRFHEGTPQHGGEEIKKAFYLRTAYRNDPEFTTSQIQRLGSVLDTPLRTAQRMIENDVRVTDNYQRLVASTIDVVYGGDHEDLPAKDIREVHIGKLREAMRRLFPDLELVGPGHPFEEGTFRFEKGAVSDFSYKNLSGGEKAAFDLLLDLVLKTEAYDDTVLCIDEPDAHLNTRIQGDVLTELLRFVNDRSQLWVATHSIGMMRRAQELQTATSGEVVFLDFENHDFDEEVVIEPTSVDRAFWSRSLEVALGDLATLVAPQRVVLCEGKPVEGSKRERAEFDARCYRRIFGDQMPDTEFVSVGNSREVETDHLRVGAAISTIVSGTTVLRVIDRDGRSEDEVKEAREAGTRVLRRRHLEAYLLDDEVLIALCRVEGQPDKVQEIIAIRDSALADSVTRGNPPDDFKSAAGQLFDGTRKMLGLTTPGNDKERFLSDTLAPLLEPGMGVYEELKQDVFG